MFDILAIIAGLLISPAMAQNVTCPNRTTGDSTNACANTRFVQQHVTPPGGATNQIQVNHGGAFAGITVSGDLTISGATGVGSIVNKGLANGIATLDSGGFIPLIELPPSITGGLVFEGNWNANTNTPALVSSVGTVGNYYFVSVAGATTLNGVSSWAIGDLLLFSSGVWNKIPGPGAGAAVTSVAGLTGAVTTSALLSAINITGAITINPATSVSTLAAGQAVANLGYTPVNKAGDTMTGLLTMSMATPAIDFNATGNAADAKRWRLIGDTSGNLVFQAVNDANSVALNALYFTRTGATPTGIQSAVPIAWGTAQTNVGQSLAISDPGPANWATFTGIRDPLRVSVNGFTTASEFGGAVSIPDVNAIVGGTICPGNYNPINGAYCGGVAGYAFNLRQATSNANYQTATGAAGYGGVGINSSAAWGLVGFVTNCPGTNCSSNSGFEGSASVPMLLTSAEVDLTTFKIGAGTNPKYTTATGLLIQGTADSQARFDRANGSTVYGLTIQVLDTNSYVNKNCDGTGTQSNCWDAAIKVADGSSAVALQVGATALNSPAAASPSQAIGFFAYSNGAAGLPAAGGAMVATDFLSAAGSRTVQYPAGGSFTFSENGSLRGSLVGTRFRIEGTVGSGIYTVATLPTCNAGLEGARAYVTDATVGTVPYTSVVVGGSSNRIPVYCNSVAWTSG